MNAFAEKAVVSTVMLGVMTPAFFASGLLAQKHAPAAWLATPWDSSIPLVPAAVWPYISWYFAPWLVLMAPRSAFRRAAAAISLAFLACTVVYIAIPVSIERPSVSGETVSERMLLLLYENDPPWNIFPSFHAVVCAILWRPAFGGTFMKCTMPIWMSAICVACLLTKQHQILDVAAGLLVGFLVLCLVTIASDYLNRKSSWHIYFI